MIRDSPALLRPSQCSAHVRVVALCACFDYIMRDEDLSIAMDGDAAGPRPRAGLPPDLPQ